MAKPLNIGMIGYGFMGRAHSNAYRKVSHFFDLQYARVLKAVCARDTDKVKAFAANWGYESTETDWRKLHRAQRHRRASTSARPTIHMHEIALAAAAGRQDDPVRKAAGHERPRRPEDGRRPSRRPASRTWSGTTTAACRP